MTTPASVGLAVVTAAMLLAPAALRAQQPQTADSVSAADLELVFEREVFEYPSFSRRNPFVALDAGNAGGPRFEQLSLIGIMYSDDPTASVAVLSTGGVSVAADGTTSPVAGDAFYVKVGQSVGNVTVRAIRREEVVVDVEEFGLTEQHTLVFLSRREGGS
jgi:hypothetical protein